MIQVCLSAGFIVFPFVLKRSCCWSVGVCERTASAVGVAAETDGSIREEEQRMEALTVCSLSCRT